MNEIKMEKMTEMEAFCDIIAKELFEIKMHICNERYFDGGVGLGALLSSVINRQMQEAEERSKNKEVQDEECDEECEESEEEEEVEDDYDESRLVQELRREIEESAHGKMKLISECSEKDSQLKSLKILVMDLQDLFIQLLSHKRINKLDIPEVIKLLKRSGIHDSDLKVRAGQNLQKDE
jgi:predicted RNase H-like nuclease (RuvC/YqgF family)